MVITKPMTAEDVWKLDEDAGRYELIRGELITMSPSGGRHAKMAARITSRLQVYVDEKNLGEVYTADPGFILARGPDILLAPDVAFVRADRMLPEEEQISFMEIAPDLVVEVVSPSDLFRHVHAKVMEYLAGGVRLVWVVQPEQQDVTVYTPDRPPRVFMRDDELDGGDVLPGFRLPLADIFR